MQLTDAKQAKRHGIPSHARETVQKTRGHPKNPVIAKIMQVKKCSRATAYRKDTKRRLRDRTIHERLEAEQMEFCSLIKPSDNWNVAPVAYPRIDDEDGHGYIPGDLLCNCLFYNTKRGDRVIDLMAGGGMIQHIYDDRALWMKPAPWDLDLRMYDLTPRGRYKEQIVQWNILDGFPPVERAPDYVLLDVPYFGCVRGQYSDRPDDIANMDVDGWTAAMAAIAQNCASVAAKLCTVMVTNYANPQTGEVVLCAEIVRDVWKAAGYELYRVAYASKHIQAGRTNAKGSAAVLNNRAKRNRIPLNDIAEVLTFRL